MLKGVEFRMARSELHIGEIAAQAGVSVDAVRYYEKRRLLPRAPRTEGGFRLFTPETVERVRFIKQAQEIGLSLEEIGTLLAIGGAGECRRMHNLLQTKLGDLDQRLLSLRDFRSTLSHYLEECEAVLEANGEEAECPVVTEIKSTRSARQGR